VEAKATTSVRGHVYRINGLDHIDPPTDGRLLLFRLRMREEATASNTLLSLVETTTTAIGDDGQALDGFESGLVQAGYSSLEAARYAEIRFRVINERLLRSWRRAFRVSVASFLDGLPAGAERVDYEIDLDSASDLIVSGSPADFRPPVV
jgi:hypothetical protein